MAGLELDDFDWRASELGARGKRGSGRLPLPAAVGEAIAAYLRDGRPAGGLPGGVFDGAGAGACHPGMLGRPHFGPRL